MKRFVIIYSIAFQLMVLFTTSHANAVSNKAITACWGVPMSKQDYAKCVETVEAREADIFYFGINTIVGIAVIGLCIIGIIYAHKINFGPARRMNEKSKRNIVNHLRLILFLMIMPLSFFSFGYFMLSAFAVWIPLGVFIIIANNSSDWTAAKMLGELERGNKINTAMGGSSKKDAKPQNGDTPHTGSEWDDFK